MSLSLCVSTLIRDAEPVICKKNRGALLLFGKAMWSENGREEPSRFSVCEQSGRRYHCAVAQPKEHTRPANGTWTGIRVLDQKGTDERRCGTRFTRLVGLLTGCGTQTQSLEHQILSMHNSDADQVRQETMQSQMHYMFSLCVPFRRQDARGEEIYRLLAFCPANLQARLTFT